MTIVRSRPFVGRFDAARAEPAPPKIDEKSKPPKTPSPPRMLLKTSVQSPPTLVV